MVLREFLIAISYQVNGFKPFMSSMTQANSMFGTLAKTAAAAGVVVVGAVAKMSDELDKLYFVSQRTKASAENLAALGYAARQTGSSADAMTSSVENMASRLRRLPGLTQMLGNMGIDGRGDPTQIMLKMRQRMSALPEWVQLQYADLFGIDEKTWLALKNMGEYIADQKAIAGSLGVDMDKAAKSANTLWTQLRRVGTTVEVLAAKVVQHLGDRYSRVFADMANTIIRNGDRIAKVIEYLVELFLKFVQAIAAIARAFMNSGEAIYNWFTNLDPAIQKVILGLGALLVAWKLLSAGFLATPLGRIIAALTALALLLDDYLVWKDRGRGANGSLIDWSWLDDNVFTTIGTAMSAAGRAAAEGWQWLIDIVEWFKTSAMGRYFSSSIGQGSPPPAGARGRESIGPMIRQGGGLVLDGLRRLFGINPAGAAQGGGAGSVAPEDVNSLMEELGFNPAQRAALLATIQRESSFNPQASVIDNNGERSHGLFQHNGPRLRAMMAWAGVSRPQDLTWQHQVMFLAHEMQTSEAGRAGRFLGATTARGAGQALTQDLIRPRDPTGTVREDRGALAEQWLQRTQRPSGGVRPADVPGMTGQPERVSSIDFNPVAYINVQTSDPSAAARQVLAGQDQMHQLAIRNLRPRIV